MARGRFMEGTRVRVQMEEEEIGKTFGNILLHVQSMRRPSSYYRLLMASK